MQPADHQVSRASNPSSAHHAPLPPDRDGGALGPYLRALRAHRTLVVLVTLTALVGSVGWLAVRVPQYRASAQLLVTPLPQDDRTFLGLQMIRDSGDPTRTVQTAAALLTSRQAAGLVAQRLGPGWTAERVAQAVDVEPVGESNILAVSARWSHPAGATRLANEYAAATLRARRQALRAQIQATIARLAAQKRAIERAGVVEGEIQPGQLQQLRTLREAPDPTLSLSQRAVVPASAAGAPAWLVMVMALIAGFTVATGAALLIDHLNRRIRDADEAIDLFPLDVLARVPLLAERQRRAAGDSPAAMPPAVQEAFRTLAVQLEQRTAGSGTIMITSASSGDGKTTSAINLAFALVAAGRRVTLIDFDLRKPDIAGLLGLGERPGLTALVRSDTAFADLLVQAPQLPPLRVVPAGTSLDGTVMLETLSRRLPEIIAQGRDTADYLILDTPPLGEVSDALRIAGHVDQILVVTRPGHTDRDHFEFMRELLRRNGSRPAGLVLLDDSSGPSAPYYGYGGARSNGDGPRPADISPPALSS